MQKIPCTLFRAGTSKGPFMLKTDLPADPLLRDKWLLRLMGSPHARQIDGIGGGDSLSSKVAIVALSQHPEADLDYLLCQVSVTEARVETTLNCGNMLSGVVPFAIMQGLVKATDPETEVRVYNENTGVIIRVTVQTPAGHIQYDGDTHIDGVPGTGAPIRLSFLNPVGAKTGKLLPTGNSTDEIAGVAVTCLDVSLPMVIVSATALGKTGYESKLELDADRHFLQRLELLREQAAFKMGLGDVSHSISPKICIVSPPERGGTIHSCYFTPFSCHAAHALSGAFCLAAACLLPGSVAEQMVQLPTSDVLQFDQLIEIEHVSGTMRVLISVDKTGAVIDFPAVSGIRTARPLLTGEVFVPE